MEVGVRVRVCDLDFCTELVIKWFSALLKLLESRLLLQGCQELIDGGFLTALRRELLLNHARQKPIRESPTL